MCCLYPNWNPPWVQGWLYDPRPGSAPPNLGAAPFNINPRLAYEGNLSNPNTAGGAGGLLWPYLKAMGVYRCPLDYTNTPSYAQRANKMSSYIQNGALCGYGAMNNRSYKQADFRQDAFMMWEPYDKPDGSTFNDGASYPDPTRTEVSARATESREATCSTLAAP